LKSKASKKSLNDIDLLHGPNFAEEILRAANDKNKVLALIIKIFLKLGFDRVRIWLVDPKSKSFYGAKANYLPISKFQKIQLPLRLNQESPGLIKGTLKRKPFINKHNPTLIKNFNDHKDVITAGFPLIVGNNIIGAISADNAVSKKILSLNEIKIKVAPFVGHVAFALNQILLNEEVKKLSKELEATSEILRAANNKNDVMKYAIKLFQKFGFDRVRIWLLDLKKKEKRGGKCSYISDKKFQSVVVSLDKQDAQTLPIDYTKMIKKKKPLKNTTFPVLKNFFNEKKLKYSIEFPMFADKNLIGLVSIDNAITQKPIDEKEMGQYMSFVNQIAIALDRATLNEKLREEKASALKIAKQLKESNKKLQDLDEAKNSFINIASHEFRTPLTVINHYAEMLHAEKSPRKSKAKIYRWHSHAKQHVGSTDQ
jgi:hypothetical protein